MTGSTTTTTEATPAPAPAPTPTGAVTLESLQAEVNRLRAENKGLNEDLRETRGEARDRRHEAREFKEKLTAAEADRDRFRAAAELDPEGVKAQLATATGELRTIRHKGAFKTAAAAHGVTDPKRVDDLWSLSGYKAEADQVDEAALTTTIKTALDGRDWLRTEPAAGAAANGTRATTPAPGQHAAGAATNGAAGAAATTTATVPNPAADRGNSLQSKSSASPGRIPGRL